MKKNARFYTIVTAAIGLIAFIYLRFIYNGGEDTWICEDGKWVEHGKPSAKKPDDSKCQKTILESTFKLVTGQKDLGNPSTTDGLTNLPINTGPAKYVRLTDEEYKVKMLVQKFYEWYITQVPNNTTTYKSRPELTQGFITKVDSIFSSKGQNGRANPILLSQGIPDKVTAENPVLKGNIGRVQLDEFFGPSAHVISVALVKENGVWKISDVLLP